MAFPSSSGVEAHADCLRNHILIKTDSSNFSETNLSSIDEKTCVRKRKRKMERPVQTDVSQNTSSWNHILNIPDPSHLSETLTTSVDLKTCARKIKMKMKSSEQADVDSQNTSLRNLELIKSNPSHFSETNPTSVDIKTYARKIKMKMRSPIQADVDTQSTSINEIKPNSPDVLTETIKKSSCHCDCSLQITSSFQVKNEPVERVELESQGSLNSGMDHQVINSEAENTTLKLSFSPSSIKTEQLSTNSDHNCVTFPQPVQVKNEPLERVELESEGSLNSSTDHQENTTLKLSFSTSSIKTEQLSTNSDHNFMTFPQPIQVKTECIETGLPAVDEADITSSPQPIGKLELFELSEEGTVPTPSPIQVKNEPLNGDLEESNGAMNIDYQYVKSDRDSTTLDLCLPSISDDIEQPTMHHNQLPIPQPFQGVKRERDDGSSDDEEGSVQSEDMPCGERPTKKRKVPVNDKTILKGKTDRSGDQEEEEGEEAIPSSGSPEFELVPWVDPGPSILGEGLLEEQGCRDLAWSELEELFEKMQALVVLWSSSQADHLKNKIIWRMESLKHLIKPGTVGIPHGKPEPPLKAPQSARKVTPRARKVTTRARKVTPRARKVTPPAREDIPPARKKPELKASCPARAASIEALVSKDCGVCLKRKSPLRAGKCEACRKFYWRKKKQFLLEQGQEDQEYVLPCRNPGPNHLVERCGRCRCALVEETSGRL